MNAYDQMLEKQLTTVHAANKLPYQLIHLWPRGIPAVITALKTPQYKKARSKLASTFRDLSARAALGAANGAAAPAAAAAAPAAAARAAVPAGVAAARAAAGLPDLDIQRMLGLPAGPAGMVMGPFGFPIPAHLHPAQIGALAHQAARLAGAGVPRHGAVPAALPQEKEEKDVNEETDDEQEVSITQPGDTGQEMQTPCCVCHVTQYGRAATASRA